MNGIELLEEKCDEIIEKVVKSSKILTSDMGEFCNDAFHTNPMVVFYDGNCTSTGLSYVEQIDERESEEKAWMWWVEGNDTEYHQFASLEEAVNDWTRNMGRIDEMMKQD